MSLAKAFSAQLTGLDSETVTIEVDISNGLHSFSVVGLGDRAVEESKDRIAAAIKNSGYVSPKQKNQKVVISLAPADVRKEGPSFDLAMAMAYLAASHEIDFCPDGLLFFGELSLEGKVRQVSGLLPLLCQASRQGFKRAFIPEANRAEASLARGLQIFAVSSLAQAIQAVTGAICLAPLGPASEMPHPELFDDISSVRGNEIAKRGLEIAAAGAHNLLMVGPAGTGKTMLARTFPSLLPPLTYEQSVDVTGIHSAAKVLKGRFISNPPFRAPHHTSSYPAIVGGGAFPRPGEITLAHRGVLFLDELPEFDRSVLEALRQPLEERMITISRAKGMVTFPAQCILIGSMNPCPCGKSAKQGCSCTPKQKDGYRKKISGPIMDRLDIWINVDKIDYKRLASAENRSEDSRTIRARVSEARTIQRERFRERGICKSFNSELSADEIDRLAGIGSEARIELAEYAEKIHMSGRSFHRIIKVARTIADLAREETIKKLHLLEALQYRQRML